MSTTSRPTPALPVPADGVLRPIRPARKLVVTIVGVSIAVWLYVGIVLILVGGNITVIPIWMVLGSFTLAAALLAVLTRRLGAGTSVTPTLLLVAFVLGGLGSVIIGGSIDTVTLSALGLLPGELLAGVAEEAAKIVLVVVIAWRLSDKTTRNGLIIGATVGLGFGAFEDLGYAMAPFLGAAFNHGEVFASMQAQAFRALTGPLGHPLWTALLSAAVFAAARNGRFRLTLGVVGAYLGVAFVHGMWDGGSGLGGVSLARFGQIYGDLGGALGAAVSLAATTTAVLVWRRVARRAGTSYRTQLAQRDDTTSSPSATRPPAH